MKMQTSVEVDVEPMAAFVAFTDELDQWWGDGHIDAWASFKYVDRRMEGHVGGRIVEVHEDGELELARITVWEPGQRVSWKSSVDDVTIEVRFDASAAGTTVSVHGELPDGGADRGGTSFLRMVPQWLPRHLDRKARGVVRPPLERLHVLVRAERPVALAHWLVDALGVEQTGDLPEADGPYPFPWVEVRVGGASIVLWRAGMDLEGEEHQRGTTHEVWIYVDDLDAALERATANGAAIVQPIHEHGYRKFTCTDPEGNRWGVLQANPAMRARSSDAPERAAAR